MLDVSFVIFSSVIIDLEYVYVFVSSPGFHEGGEATISGSFVLDDGGDGLKGAAGPLHHFQNQEMGNFFWILERSFLYRHFQIIREMHNDHTRYGVYWSNSRGFVLEYHFHFIVSLEISLLVAGVTLEGDGRDIWIHNHHHRDIGCWGGIYELVYSLPSPHTILHPRLSTRIKSFLFTDSGRKVNRNPQK